MHMVNTYESLRGKLEREVEAINNIAEFTEQSINNLHHMIEAINGLNCLIDKEYSYDNGQSNGYYNDGHSYKMPMWMMDGRSNGMSRDNFRDYSNRGWYGEIGYSRDNARQKMINKLETLKDDTMSDYERKAINNCIEDISRQ